MQQRRPLAVGDLIHGFAQGAFGRDHYDCVRIEATGPDWIVARSADGGVSFAAGADSLRFLLAVRDEVSCSEAEGCPVENLVQLTESGGFHRG